MLKRIPLFAILAILAYGFWISPDFKTISAGVAIFLFGMILLEQGFSSFTGGRLEKLLDVATHTPLRALGFGFATTTVVQSSSLVSIIAISFMSAGLIGLSEGIGIIYGANLGTTTGAWLMAGFGMKVKIAEYALPMLVFGIILHLNKSRSIKGFGKVLAGLGFLLLGIHYMKVGFESFKQTIDLASLAIDGFTGLLVFCAVGIIATVIMQSSHATLMIIIAALASGQITYDNALALVIGANVGTTITAVLGALSTNAAGKRLALAHVMFKVTTAVVFIAFIGTFGEAVDWIALQVGIADDDWVLKLAVFHTLFNLVGVALLMPFIGPQVRFLEKRFVGPDEGPSFRTARFLSPASTLLPDTTLRALLEETEHLFDNAFEIIAHSLNLHRRDILSDKPLDEVVESSREIFKTPDAMVSYYRNVKLIYNEVIEYSVVAKGNLTEHQLEDIFSLRIICRNIAKAIRLVAHSRRTFNTAISSSNTDLRFQYNRFRLLIARILRAIHFARLSDDEESVLLIFAGLERELDETEVLTTGTLDYLVRNQLLNSSEATSLINDAASIQDLGTLLIEVGRRFFTFRSDLLREVEDELLLKSAPEETLQEASTSLDRRTHPRLMALSLSGSFRARNPEEEDDDEDEEEEAQGDH